MEQLSVRHGRKKLLFTILTYYIILYLSAKDKYGSVAELCSAAFYYTILYLSVKDKYGSVY